MRSRYLTKIKRMDTGKRNYHSERPFIISMTHKIRYAHSDHIALRRNILNISDSLLPVVYVIQHSSFVVKGNHYYTSSGHLRNSQNDLRPFRDAQNLGLAGPQYYVKIRVRKLKRAQDQESRASYLGTYIENRRVDKMRQDF